LPHVRFTRDKRGYEHTFLVRRGPKGRGDGTVLYWFRSPPDVRVGRRPLDQDSAEAIEHAFPDVQFDWPRLREAHAARTAGEERAADPRPDRRTSRRRPDPARKEHAKEQTSAQREPASDPARRHAGETSAHRTSPAPGDAN
jgi:hypothetical protein